MASILTDKFAAAVKAAESVPKLYTEALACAELHSKAGMPLPLPIAALVSAITGEQSAPTAEQKAKVQRRPISPPSPPPQSGWISVALASAMPQTAVPIVLKENGGPLMYYDVAKRIRDLGMTVRDGSVLNIGTRLSSDGIIDQTPLGWVLIKPQAAALLRDGRLWGPVSCFQPQEVASHRRDAIVALLQAYGSLSRGELIEVLQATDWVEAPVNMSLVKADLIALQDDELIRRTNDAGDTRSFKWELVPEIQKGQKQLRLA